MSQVALPNPEEAIPVKLWKTNMGSLTITSHKSYLLALALDFKLLLYIPLSVKKEEGSTARPNWEEAL